MGEQIRTKWHRVMELIRDGQLYFTAPPGGVSPHCSDMHVDPDRLAGMLEGMEHIPRFVFDQKLFDLAQDGEFHKSLLDMKKADLLHLPFEEVVVELPYRMEGSNDPSWVIAYLGEMEFIKKHHPRIDFNGSAVGIVMMIKKDHDGEYVVLGPSYMSLDILEIDNQPMVQFQCLAGPWWPDMNAAKREGYADKVNKLVADTYSKDGMWLGTAWFAILLIMSTKGVVKEHIDPVKLNQHRAKSGKVKVPRHTYVHIGHVYQKDGSTVAYDERKSPRPHWRRGHIRNLRVGVGRTGRKPTWIEPMLVAYHGDEFTADLKTPDYRVVD